MRRMLFLTFDDAKVQRKTKRDSFLRVAETVPLNNSGTARYGQLGLLKMTLYEFAETTLSPSSISRHWPNREIFLS